LCLWRGLIRENISLGQVFRVFGLVFVGNFAGALVVAFMMAFIFTYGFDTDGGAIAQKVGHIGEARTLGYSSHGIGGWITIFIRGMLCNWMVSTGVAVALISSSVIGKIFAMWMPIMLFFFMGFEHSVVNMFLFPFSMIMGGGFTIMDYLVWNEIPTVLGNIVGGLLFVGLPIYYSHYKESPKRTLK